MTRWFTSDLHFGHRNILTYCNRPYKEVYYMDRDLIRIWNETIKPGDTVYVLGDFSLNKNYSKTITPLLNGNKILIVGNHDKPFKHIVKSNEVYSKENLNRIHNEVCEQYLQDGWQSIHKELEVTLRDGTNVLCSHLPYASKEGTKFDTRYLEQRPKDNGLFLLHGHIHGRYKKLNNMIDVGHDAHCKPINEDEIIQLMNDERNFIESPITEWYKERDLKRVTIPE